MWELLFIALRAGDQIPAVLGKEVRPLLQTVLVDHVDIVGDQVLDSQPHTLVDGFVLRRGVHRQASINARYFFQKPRTDASVARNGCECASKPPIINTPASSSTPRTARCTNPGTAPSS